MRRNILIAVLACIAALTVLVGVVWAAQTIFGTVGALRHGPTWWSPPQPEDLDGDGCVGPRDLALVARNLGLAGPSQGGADINKDGLSDIIDVSSVAHEYGTRNFGTAPCP